MSDEDMKVLGDVNKPAQQGGLNSVLMQDFLQGRTFTNLRISILAGICVICLVLIYIGGSKINNMPVHYFPAEGSLNISGVGEVSKEGVREFASFFVLGAETWDQNNVVDVPNKMKPYVHPKARAAFNASYVDFAKQYEKRNVQQSLNVLGAFDVPRSDGVISYAVAIQRHRFSARKGKEMKFIGSETLVVYYIIEPYAQSKDNRFGLVVANNKVLTVDEWKKAGYSEFWTTQKSTKK